MVAFRLSSSPASFLPVRPYPPPRVSVRVALASKRGALNAPVPPPVRAFGVPYLVRVRSVS